MPPVFRKTPPIELIDNITHAFYLRNHMDPTPFTQTMINLDILDELLYELEPYYLPCKAQLYLHEPLTHARALVILRQTLKSHGLCLKSSEKTQGSSKVTWYQISSPKGMLNNEKADFTVSFS